MVLDWTGEEFARRICATSSSSAGLSPGQTRVRAEAVGDRSSSGEAAPHIAVDEKTRSANTVLLYTDSHSFCGIGQKSAVLLQALRGAGYRVVCAQRHEATPLQDRLTALGVEYVWFESNPDDDLKAFALDRATPARTLSTIQPDLIVFANGRPAASLSAKAAASFLSIPYIIVEATTAPHLLPKAADGDLHETTRAQYLEARAVVTVCEENLDNLKSAFGLPLEFGRVIYQGPSEDFFAPVDQDKRRARRQEIGIDDDTVLCFTAATSRATKYSCGRFRRFAVNPCGTPFILRGLAKDPSAPTSKRPSPSSIFQTV